ncbi:MAG: S8 family serine peptidase [Nonomuraea sp.]|nr:S8 family serine peptidase [Nonomuraea sp.]
MAAAVPQPILGAMGVGAPAIDSAKLHELLDRDPQVKVHRQLKMPSKIGLLSADTVAFPDVTVAEMTSDHAESLAQQLPQIHLERDHLLTYTDVGQAPNTKMVLPLGLNSTFSFLVTDSEGSPIPGTTIQVTGSLWPAQTVTDKDGRATVTLTGETPESIVAVEFKPESGYWSLLAARPALSTRRDNLIVLKHLSDTIRDFPEQQTFGWGQEAMQLHRLPPTFRGAGAKVAIIDSGVGGQHNDLEGQVTKGVDLVDRRAQGWRVDTVHHGSHCAGVITGADNGHGVIGFAVEAEVHACKIFPGGRMSDLIEAIDYCIHQEIDVINLSLGTPESSALVAAKLEEARNAGVAAVVAAGNDGGPVNFPGSLPIVLTVAAIGRAGTYPEDSSHAAQVLEPHTSDGYFSAQFTCHGPGVDVCAPGVAVLSSIPPDDYAAWDGTSMAAPHVTGLAALVLAHHDDFQAQFKSRDSRRVERLFQIIKSSCTPLDLGDPGRSGAGLPDAFRALAKTVTGVVPNIGDIQAMLDQLTGEMQLAGLLPPVGVPTQPWVPQAAAPLPQDPRVPGPFGWW